MIRALPIGPPPSTLDEALERMRAIEAALPPADGVAWFNRLYLRMTEAVAGALSSGVFADRRWMDRLTVGFAHLYLRALAADHVRSDPVPRAWAPLFEVRVSRRIAPIQFALAGMNAHINRDLPVAVVETLAALGLSPDRRRLQDFMRLTPILEATQADAKSWFATGFAGIVDEVFGDADDVVAIWSLTRARETAWHNARTLHFLRDVPDLAEAFLTALDRMVGLAGRGLLTPTA